MRLCKHTSSPEPSLITFVISTSRVFTSSYEAPRKMISCSGPSCVQEKSTRMIEVPSMSVAISFKMLKREGRVGGVSRIT